MVKVSTAHTSAEKATPSPLGPPPLLVAPHASSSKSTLSPSASVRLSSFHFPPSDEDAVELLASPRSSMFYKTGEGEVRSHIPDIADASPHYSEEGHVVEDDAEPSAMSHETYESARMTTPSSTSHIPDYNPRPTSPSYPHPPPTSPADPHPPPPPLLMPPSPFYTQNRPPELHLRRSVTSSPKARPQSRSAPSHSSPLPLYQQSRSTRSSGNLHPYLQNFTSPIDLLDHR